MAIFASPLPHASHICLSHGGKADCKRNARVCHPVLHRLAILSPLHVRDSDQMSVRNLTTNCIPMMRPPRQPAVSDARNSHLLSYSHELPSGKRMEVIVRRGQGKAELSPIVFLHGSYHAAWCWEKWLPYFANQGHDCYAISFLGQGKSDISGAYGGTMKSHADDVADAIRAIPHSPIVIGHSFGGLVVQSLLTRPLDEIADASTPARPPLAGAILLCSVPPSGNGGMVKRYLRSKPIASIKITLSLAAQGFKKWTWLCKDTFFSPEMPEEEVKRYQTLMANSSKVPMFDHKTLNEDLPVGKPFCDKPHVAVIGAANDFVVDEEAIQETADFYDTVPIIVPKVAHDMMLDVDWELAAATVGEVVAALTEPCARV